VVRMRSCFSFTGLVESSELVNLRCTYVVVKNASLYKALVVWVALFELEAASSHGSVDLMELMWKT
jgi:hypothetical protein